MCTGLFKRKERPGEIPDDETSSKARPVTAAGGEGSTRRSESPGSRVPVQVAQAMAMAQRDYIGHGGVNNGNGEGVGAGQAVTTA